MFTLTIKSVFAAIFLITAPCFVASAQVPPSSSEIAAYQGLHLAAHTGDIAEIKRLAASGTSLESGDQAGRTPLHIAAYASSENAARALVKAGANPDALENQAYDIMTIAAVANDLEMLDAAIELGCNPGNITSPYIGTALIAAAHLGHYEIVEHLIAAGAPLDHINNLQWTALMEAVVLGNGGPDHIKTVRALVDAGADKSIGESDGTTPLEHAIARGYDEIVKILEGG